MKNQVIKEVELACTNMKAPIAIAQSLDSTELATMTINIGFQGFAVTKPTLVVSGENIKRKG